MSEKIQAVRGMNDILPDQAHWWERFEDTVRDWLHAYGYRNIRMPVLERTDLFVRSIGEVTDIVEKEMYTFVDQMNGESLTLRPEGTAPVARAYAEHGMHKLPQPVKLWYLAPMFRYEAPQSGRFREHWQLDLEAIGSDDPAVDAELIALQLRWYEALGLDLARDFSTFETLGNTGSVALPATLALAAEAGAVKAGDRVALLGIGSGLNCLMLALEW